MHFKDMPPSHATLRVNQHLLKQSLAHQNLQSSYHTKPDWRLEPIVVTGEPPAFRDFWKKHSPQQACKSSFRAFKLFVGGYQLPCKPPALNIGRFCWSCVLLFAVSNSSQMFATFAAKLRLPDPWGRRIHFIVIRCAWQKTILSVYDVRHDTSRNLIAYYR